MSAARQQTHVVGGGSRWQGQRVELGLRQLEGPTVKQCLGHGESGHAECGDLTVLLGQAPRQEYHPAPQVIGRGRENEPRVGDVDMQVHGQLK